MWMLQYSLSVIKKNNVNLCVHRHYTKLPHHLCEPVRPGGVWAPLHLASLCHHLVLCGPGCCPALWPPVCLQHHSGEYNWTNMFPFFLLPSVTADIGRKLMIYDTYQFPLNWIVFGNTILCLCDKFSLNIFTQNKLICLGKTSHCLSKLWYSAVYVQYMYSPSVFPDKTR